MIAAQEIRLLEDCAVLELSDGVAASFAAKVLADLGAKVTMFELGGRHALRDSSPACTGGPSGRFAYLSAGKLLSTTDPVTLISEADIVITDWTPEQVGSLTQTSSGPSMVFISPFGISGPKAGDPAEHLTIFHASGEGSTLPSGRGFELYPDRPPVQLGSDIGFFDAGWTAALVAIALLRQSRSGGAHASADVSIQESVLSCSRTRMNRWLNEDVCVGREGPRYGIAGMLRCRDDGWIQLVGMREESWDRLLQSGDGDAFRTAGFSDPAERTARQQALGQVLADWCQARSKFEASTILSRAGAPVGVFADASDCLDNEQLRHRGFWREVDDRHGGELIVPGSPYLINEIPRPAAARTGPTGTRLLEGMRILDFTWAAAGPYATLLLAFLGADVVKVESMRRLDPARWGFVSRSEDLDRSPIFNELNLGKRSLQLDLTQPESPLIIREMLGDFDAVVNNFRPGVMDRLGLGAETLLPDFPHLIIASSSAYGATGPEATGAGLASIFAASGGLSAQTGYEDGPPTEVSDTMDYRCGTAFAVAIAAGLLRRECTGAGCIVDLSSRDVALASAPDAALAESLGIDWRPRIGNGHRTMKAHGVYPTADGAWVAVAVPDQRKPAVMSDVLGRDGHAQLGDRIDSELSEWIRSRSGEEVVDALRALDVAVEKVMSFEALASDPHLIARNVFVEVDHPTLGSQRVMRPPWIVHGTEPQPIRPGPLLGQHTDNVLSVSPIANSLSPQRRTELLH